MTVSTGVATMIAIDALEESFDVDPAEAAELYVERDRQGQAAIQRIPAARLVPHQRQGIRTRRPRQSKKQL
jgi:hypothetical protein